MKTLLFSGQSNAQDHAVAGDFEIDSRVTVWNVVPEVLNATTGLGSAFTAVSQSAPPFLHGGTGIPFLLASHLARMLDDDVRLVSVTHSGKSIDNWTGANGTPAVMLNRIFAALAAAGVTSVDGIGWHQGETYSADYARKFNDMIINLKAVGTITTGVPIVIGELAAQYTAMNATLQYLADRQRDVRLANIQHLPTYDTIHFTGPSKNRAAIAYAKHFMEAWA